MSIFTAPEDVDPLLTQAYDYELPEALIAAHPPEVRGAARMMRVDRGSGRIEHSAFNRLPEALREHDLLVFNNTRVVPGRLIAHKPTGGRVELLILERLGVEGLADPWRAPAEGGVVRMACMTRTSKRLKAPVALTIEGSADDPDEEILVVEAEPGRAIIEARVTGDPLAWLEARGHIPLPPYILKRREALGESTEDTAEDAQRYQTVFADEAGAIAAPTAGLHFTEGLLAALAELGVQTTTLTLHVGPGTFKPVSVDALAEHPMHAEPYVIPEGLGARIAACKAAGGRVIAVGTTSMRTLEAEARRDEPFIPGRRSTDLFLHPHNPPILCDGLITNLHLPRSTLLALVAATTGYPLMRRIYEEAVAHAYMFYSYGDGMLIL